MLRTFTSITGLTSIITVTYRKPLTAVCYLIGVAQDTRDGRALATIEDKVVELRKYGINRYEIVVILRGIFDTGVPSPSGVYNIMKCFNVSKLTTEMKEKARMIIKQKAGELGHIDCHYLSKGLLLSDNKRYFMVGVVDSCTRLLWVDIVEDIKAMTVMFGVLRCLNVLSVRYGVQFSEVLTDNGSEFGSGRQAGKE